MNLLLEDMQTLPTNLSEVDQVFGGPSHLLLALFVALPRDPAQPTLDSVACLVGAGHGGDEEEGGDGSQHGLASVLVCG